MSCDTPFIGQNEAHDLSLNREHFLGFCFAQDAASYSSLRASWIRFSIIWGRVSLLLLRTDLLLLVDFFLILDFYLFYRTDLP